MTFLRSNYRTLFITSALLMTGLFASLFAIATDAQDATEEAMMAEPPAESHQLDWFIGEWEVQSRLKMSDDPEEWLEETVQSTVTPIIGDFALMETYTGTFGGTPIDAVSLRTYNSNIGKWQQRWIDNTSPGFAHYTGEYADGQFIGTSDASFKSEEEGGRGENNGTREVFYDIEDDRFSWRLETTTDGGETWMPVWYLEYTRDAM